MKVVDFMEWDINLKKCFNEWKVEFGLGAKAKNLVFLILHIMLFAFVKAYLMCP